MMSNDRNIALLIIDVQVMPFAREQYDGAKIYNSEQLLENIHTLADKARASHVPVIYMKFEGNDDLPIDVRSTLLEIHPQIKPHDGDLVLTKNYADCFHSTNLHKELQSMNITDLVITGLQTEYCVDTTCRRAFSMGYNTILVSDGHSTFDTNDLSASHIIEYHNGILGGKDPYAVKFVQLKEAKEVNF